jgi:hypothetical protein
LTSQDGIYGGVDGSLLVIACYLSTRLLEIRGQCVISVFLLFQLQNAAPAVPEFIRGRKLLKGVFPLR